MIEIHPYGHFIPTHPKCMIIGSFPIAKFTNPKRRGEIKPHEIDFFFGGEKNLLWKLLGECYGRELKRKDQIISFLEDKGIAIGDVIYSCRRFGGMASDSALHDITWNVELLKVIRKHKIKKIYFTSKQVHKWFKRLFPGELNLEEVPLISPSAQSARAIVRSEGYRQWRLRNPEGSARSYILESYKRVFIS